MTVNPTDVGRVVAVLGNSACIYPWLRRFLTRGRGSPAITPGVVATSGTWANGDRGLQGSRRCVGSGDLARFLVEEPGPPPDHPPVVRRSPESTWSQCHLERTITPGQDIR